VVCRKQKPKITIQTQAYNAENYIHECVESVLNQSFTEFEWLILDNGSTDTTSFILEEYARKDERIKLFKNPKNTILFNEPYNPDYIKYFKSIESDYWCLLDSDDYLHFDFLKELYSSAKLHNADIAVGGTEMFSEENPKVRNKRNPQDFFISEIASLGDILPEIYGCFRPMWGKLFKVEVVKKQQKFREQNPMKLLNGGDTIFCLDCLGYSNSVVGVNKTLHYYRIRKTSHYHSQVDKYRYIDYKIIYNETKKLLKSWGKLNDINANFIASVLYFSIKDCIEIASKAEAVPPEYRLEVLETIFSDQSLYEVLDKGGFTNNLFLDTHKNIDLIFKNLTDSDTPYLINNYVYRLYMSINMVEIKEINKQNAFLLYISSLLDKKNINKIGSTLLYSFFSFIGKHNLIALEKIGVRSRFLAENPVLIREMLNNNSEKVFIICEENSGIKEYDLLKSSYKSTTSKPIEKEKNIIKNLIIQEKFDEAIDLLIEVLDSCPLDKEALSYKLHFLMLNGDLLTSLETAWILIELFPEDITTLKLASEVFGSMGLKEEAREVLSKAISVGHNEIERT
jgi:glycosyltransferase involved in cell wall biosynthesis